MPVAFALLFGALSGGALAWVAAPSGRRAKQTAWLAQPIGIVSGFTWLVFAPTVAYFLFFHGDWAYLYVVPWRKVPSAVDLVVAVGAAASLPAAFRVSSGLIRKGQTQALISGLSGIALLLLLLLIATSRRLAMDATYTEFASGFAGRPVLEGALGRGIVLAWLVLAFGLFWAVRTIRRGERNATRTEPDR